MKESPDLGACHSLNWRHDHRMTTAALGLSLDPGCLGYSSLHSDGVQDTLPPKTGPGPLEYFKQKDKFEKRAEAGRSL